MAFMSWFDIIILSIFIDRFRYTFTILRRLDYLCSRLLILRVHRRILAFFVRLLELLSIYLGMFMAFMMLNIKALEN